MQTKPNQRRTGLRQEASVFLPVSTLALMILSVVSMLSYRGALMSITEREQAEVLAGARQTASILPLNASTSTALARTLPPNSNGALIEANGNIRVSSGIQLVGDPFAPLQGAPSQAMTAGPNPKTQGRVVAWLPLRNGLILRIDRDRPSLAAEWTRWRRLLIVITLAVGALGTLLLLYLRRLFAPLDSLLQTARQLEGEAFGEDGPTEEDDEIEYLVHRFESAMKALREQRELAHAAHLEEDAEGKLEGQLSTLQQTFSRLESGMALVDLEGKVLALNQAGTEILAVPEMKLPTPLACLLKGHPSLLKLLQTAMATNRSLRRQECSIQLGGQHLANQHLGRQTLKKQHVDRQSLREQQLREPKRTLGLTLSPLTWDDGTPRGWIVLFADLTDARQKAERERLSTSLDQLAELSAGLAHELRNSLASMQGYAALLHRADLPPTAAADTVELQREMEQLHRIVEDFLSFARPGTSRLEDVDLLRLAHRVASDPALGGAAIKVITELAPAPNAPSSQADLLHEKGTVRDPRTVQGQKGSTVQGQEGSTVQGQEGSTVQGQEKNTVLGDEQLLHRLLRNLLLNAVRAQNDADLQEPVIVRITSQELNAETKNRAQLAVHIEDCGPGLSSSAEKSLFVPFATDSQGGSGLGLAVARRIADLHGARLEIQNRKGAGVRASVLFRTQAT